MAVLAALSTGCKKDGDTPADGGPSGEGPRLERAPQRAEPLALGDLDERAGMLSGGAVFVAVRAGVAQDALRQIPLPSDVTREFAEARRDLGFDPISDDVLARFSIPSDGVVTMTLGRPLGVASRRAVAKSLQGRNDLFLGFVSRALRGDPEPPVDPLFPPKPEPPQVEPIPGEPSQVEPAPPTPPLGSSVPQREEPIPPPISPPPEPWPIEPLPPPPPPPSLTPTERSALDDLLHHADGMAMQFQLRVPSDDPARIVDELRTRLGSEYVKEGTALCHGLSVDLCLAGSNDALLVRRDGKAAVLDLIAFTGRMAEHADAKARHSVLVEALDTRQAELPGLAAMAGHGSLYLDAAAFGDLLEHERTIAAIRDLSWSDPNPADGLARHLDEIERLRRLLEAPRLFDGVLVNAHYERDRAQLQITWPLREGQAGLAREVLTPPPLAVPVPTLAGLCDGSLACARSRGLPSPQQLGTKLGLGIYGDPRQLEDALDAHDEGATALVLASTWPNALGTLLWHAPLSETRGGGPEAALARSLLDAVGRIQGFGLGVRRVDVGRRAVIADFAAYARVAASDLALVGTLLAMAEQRLTTTTVQGVEGTVSMLRIPEDDLPSVLMTREDPETVASAEGKPVRYGWLTLVDGPERLAWLLGLPTDDGEEPFVYGEIPDLWRLVATVPDAVDELAFARTWAAGRTVKAALRLDDGQPHLLVEAALAGPR